MKRKIFAVLLSCLLLGSCGAPSSTSGTSSQADAAPAAESSASSEAAGPAAAATEGVGVTYTFRQNATGTSFYNVTFAFVQFDADGKITDSYIDVLEIADPTVTMASCPRYAAVGDTVDWYDLETQETTQVEMTPEMAQELVSSWRTKRERRDEYGMAGAGEWYEQMDAYQAFFQGKTVEELKEWEATGLDENGKPVDAVSGATMSVNDAHSDILGAIYKAWDNRSDYIACEKEGYGFTYTVRQNAAGTTFYNVAFSRVKLDEADKIVDNYEDVLEIADPTVTMASCPRYAVVGDTVDWYDLETQETTQVEVTPEMAQELVSSWRTKRERGDEYGMVGAGEWYEQMDAYQAFFNGKTAEELTQWEATGLDENGKPVDAVAGATMSINDAHSDILGALLKAIDAAV